MNAQEKEQLQDEIKREIQELTATIASLKEENTEPVEPSVAIGRLTRMEAISQKSVSEANLNSAIKKRDELEKTLTNMYNDDFGKCIKCGNDIPIARIQAVPESNKCVKCA